MPSDATKLRELAYCIARAIRVRAILGDVEGDQELKAVLA